MRKLLILFFAFALFSCNKNKVYEKFDKDFPQNRWMKENVRTFDFDLDNDGFYAMDLDFSHVDGFQFDGVPVKVDLRKSGNAVLIKKLTIKVKENGKQLADCGGDYCDISHSVFDSMFLKKGKYTVNVIQEFSGPYVPNVIGVGIDVRKPENK